MFSNSKRRGLSQYKANARDAAEAAARSAAAAQYTPLLESLCKKHDLIESLKSSKSSKGLAFQWNSPLEGMGRTYKLDDLAKVGGRVQLLGACTAVGGLYSC